MEQYKPHPGAKFEGYYTRVLLPSGATLIFIICTVPNAPKKAYNTMFTHVSAEGEIWQQEDWPDDIEFRDVPGGAGFQMIAHQASSEISLDARPAQTIVTVKSGSVDFIAHISNHTPWSSWTNTPESWLSYLPLPLHWHVYSLSSTCTVELTLPASANLHPSDRSCTATSHLEKNWATSFPSAHIWIQARHGGRGLCLAGGKILGMHAFLVGYRNEELGLEVDFRPPFALKAFGGLGPFMEFSVDWESRTFSMTVQDLVQKLVVRASAPKGSFYALSAPYPGGMKENWIAQSLKGTVEVEVWKSAWGLGKWRLVCEDELGDSGLEFGGEYFPLRGSEKKRN